MDEQNQTIQPDSDSILSEAERNSMPDSESKSDASSFNDTYGFPPLTPEEARALGCLVEKQLTTPEYYPMTVNALLAACNQKNNRFPVVEYDQQTVVKAMDGLRTKKFAWMVAAEGGRVPRCEHRMVDRLFLNGNAELAILSELLIRGPQTPGELRSRADRMRPFHTAEDVQVFLDALAGLPAPLVEKLPKQPGKKECRYGHLLSGKNALTPVETAPRAQSFAEALGLPDDSGGRRAAALEEEVKKLRAELDALRAVVDEIKSQL